MAARLHVFRFSNAQATAAREWVRIAQSMAGGDMAAMENVPTGSVVGWRLVSDNHREIARGAELAASEYAAAAEALQIARRAGELRVQAPLRPASRSIRWFATLEGDVVLLGARSYDSRVTASNAGALAVRSLEALGRDPLFMAQGSS